MIQSSKGMIRWNRTLCDFCGTCVGVCASDAITLFETEWIIDRKRCILCRYCQEVCPVGALEVVPQAEEAKVCA